MSCNFEEDLSAYLDRELPFARSQQVEAHLAGCPGCRQLVALLRQTTQALPSLPALEPSLSLRREVMARLDALESPSRFWAWLRPSALVPALGLAGVLAVVVTSRPAAFPEADLGQLELAENLEVAEDLEVAGVESPEDLEVVAQLEQLYPEGAR